MPITFHSQEKFFHLQAGDSSYVLGIGPKGHLLHYHWGGKIRGESFRPSLRMVDRAFSPNPDPNNCTFSFDTLPSEYPSYGRGDFRSPAIELTFADGSGAFDLAYSTHRIAPGKPRLEGLPATYVEKEDEADTLEVDLVDAFSKLSVTLIYTAFRAWNVIARSVRIRNGGGDPVVLRRVLSASVDVTGEYEMLHLSGAWGRERHIARRPLSPGLASVESRRGASSHAHNPFIALLAPQTTETRGEVRAFSLVYSGNFLAQAETDSFGLIRAQIGINPFEFSWELRPGEAFQSPEAVMVYSCAGLNGMSRQFHELYRSRLCRGPWRDRQRPIVINHWEATAFDFDEAQLCEIAGKAQEHGVEMFVMDDGWFGKRDNEKSSLGDWTANGDKLPNGLCGLAHKIHKRGLKFGLWMEPEMVSPESDLYRRHPDWCLHVPNRSRTVGRNQLVLDLSRPEVCNWSYHTLAEILTAAPIDYVKWDMNRNMTEIGSPALPPARQGEVATRYILGLYGILERLNREFPHILFEGCSGGGGRFDPGMLYYMPQTWTSDTTDAIARLEIQYSTSLVYPLIAMTAHVSAAPNHQVGRITPLATRGHVAMAANFGYEMDLGKLSADEQKEVAGQVEFYKGHRQLIQFGVFYRLMSPYEENGAAWMVVSANRDEAIVWFIHRLSVPNAPDKRVRLLGLDPARDYECAATGQIVGGDVLQEVGLAIPPATADFQSHVWVLRARVA